MADRKISDLSALVTPDGADEFAIVDTSVTETKKITYTNLSSAVSSSVASAVVSDVAYDATSWDSVTTVAPSKNAIRDKMVTVDSHIASTSNPHSVTKSQVGLSNVDNTSDLNKPISTATQTALDGKVDENVAITGATKTKITYDAKGLVTAGADATTADIADSTNARYVTDAQLTVIGNTSGTNTGDQDLSSYAVDANVVHKTGTESIAGAKTFTDDISLVKASGTARAIISAANATDPKILSFRTANVQRWAFRVDGSGDDIFMRRYDNSGVFIDAPMSADRSTGVVTINGATMASKYDASNPSSYIDAAGAVTAVVSSSITNGVTNKSPSEDAVFDALALKYDASNPSSYIDAAGAVTAVVSSSITNGVTNKSPSEDAVFDALALKYDASNPSSYVDAAGAKTAAVSDVAYDSTTWNGVTDVAPSKNAVRDQVETMNTSISAKAAKAGDTFTGAVIPSVVTLTDAATIAVNATLGNQFTVTLGGNRTLENPTGAVNGQLLLFAIRQDGAGSRTLAFDTKFRFGTDITAITLTTAINKTDYIGVRYHSVDDRFDIISVVKGY